jgi:hypothetical protein
MISNYLIKVLFVSITFTFQNVVSMDNFPVASQYYVNHRVLIPDVYQIFWNTTEENIKFEVHAKTPGYAAFGISPNGGMPFSDIVAFWVESTGTFNFTDRYIDQTSTVYIDKKKDWHEKSVTRDGQYLIAVFERKIKICDNSDALKGEDNQITEGVNHVIYSFGDVVNGDISYHGPNQRGTKVLQLIGKQMETVQINESQLEKDDFVINVN